MLAVGWEENVHIAGDTDTAHTAPAWQQHARHEYDNNFKYNYSMVFTIILLRIW